MELEMAKTKHEQKLKDEVTFKPEISPYAKSLKFEEPVHERLFNLSLNTQDDSDQGKYISMSYVANFMKEKDQD